MGGRILNGKIFNQLLKPATTYSEQIELLISRGCEVTDGALFEKVLSQVNYYRFSAYFFHLNLKTEITKKEQT
jgi:abortive infection bacteriophage resistance protein